VAVYLNLEPIESWHSEIDTLAEKSRDGTRDRISLTERRIQKKVRMHILRFFSMNNPPYVLTLLSEVSMSDLCVCKPFANDNISGFEDDQCKLNPWAELPFFHVSALGSR
jgi:hypothetical protein